MLDWTASSHMVAHNILQDYGYHMNEMCIACLKKGKKKNRQWILNFTKFEKKCALFSKQAIKGDFYKRKKIVHNANIVQLGRWCTYVDTTVL